MQINNSPGLREDIDLQGLQEQIIFWFTFFLMSGLAMFVLLMKRELSSFYLIQDLKKSQMQLMNVLNAQSDAVIVVQ